MSGVYAAQNYDLPDLSEAFLSVQEFLKDLEKPPPK